MDKTTVCIVGAGPGGATAALHLANKGIRCTLLDRAVFPRDKVCGDALSGKVVNELRRIDERLPGQLTGEPFQIGSWGIHFVAPNGQRISVPFTPGFNPSTDRTPGHIARRVDFDNFLIRQVRQRPEITLREGTDIRTYERTSDGFMLGDATGKFRIFTRLLIVANGAQSGFTRHVAGIPVESKHYCAGIRAYYRNVSGLDAHNFIELHFLKDFLPGYLWIFPLPNGYANVGVGMRSDRIRARKVNLKTRLHECLATHPALRERFAQAELVSTIQGFGLPLGSKKRTLSGDHFMLVGDAAHLIDPFSGEGISNAMISGRWAAEQVQLCVAATNFSASFMQQYDKTVYRRLGTELRLSTNLQHLLRYPRLFNWVANQASRNPTLANTLSSMFVDVPLRAQFKHPAFYGKLLFGR